MLKVYTLKSTPVAVALVVCVVVYRLTDSVILTIVWRAGVQLLIAVPAAVLGVTRTQVVIDEVTAVPIDAGVRATLVYVLVTVGSWREKGIKLRNVEIVHLILFKNYCQ